MNLTDSRFIGGVSFLLGAAVGGGVTFLVLKDRIENKYIEISNKEIKDAEKFYSRINKSEYPTPADAVAALIPEKVVDEDEVILEVAATAMRNYQGSGGLTEEEMAALEDTMESEREESVVRNVFIDNVPLDADDFDLEEELKTRDERVPFLITEEEFLEAAPGYDQGQLTYFMADDVLIDERDMPIDNIAQTVGEENLNRFGNGSKSKDIVFVRNHHLMLDFEICRDNSSYQEKVLGTDPDENPGELKHSHMRRNRRGDDD